MDTRRLNSTTLAELGSEAYDSSITVLSPQESPKVHSGRLPALWKSLKAKLGALSTSRSANNLSSLAGAACATPSASPPKPALGLCEGRSFHALSVHSHRVFLSGSSPGGTFARQATAPLEGEGTGNKNVSRDSSPTAIFIYQNALSTGPGNSSGSLIKPVSISESLPPSIAEAPLRVETDNQIQPVYIRVIPEAVATANRKLLAVSPVLPSVMRRAVWALEDYSVSRRVFKGSSSAVYMASCRRSGLPVALKVYFLSRVPANVVHMLKREIEIHTQLVHKHVVRLYAAFMDEGDRVVLVQEYAGRGDLYGILQRTGGRMPPEQVAEGVIRPSLEALTYLHSRGICHRDIKPENILFTQSWRLVVADFGVSIDLNQERAVTRAGTEGYMAPEVERCPLKSGPNDNKDDPRYAYSSAVDVWAVGVLAYELMVGFPPAVMSGGLNSDAAAAASKCSGVADDVSISGFVMSHMSPASLHFPASVPPAARAFVLSTVASDPLERPTAAQLLRHPWLQPKPTSLPAEVLTPSSAAASPEVSSSFGGKSGVVPRTSLICSEVEDLISKSPAGTAAVAGVQRPLGRTGSPVAAVALCPPA